MVSLGADRFRPGETEEVGHGAGLLPSGAGSVLRRRFGDCKDKAVLFITLARRLGGRLARRLGRALGLSIADAARLRDVVRVEVDAEAASGDAR